MLIEIKSWFSGSVLFSCDARSLKAALEGRAAGRSGAQAVGRSDGTVGESERPKDGATGPTA